MTDSIMAEVSRLAADDAWLEAMRVLVDGGIVDADTWAEVDAEEVTEDDYTYEDAVTFLDETALEVVNLSCNGETYAWEIVLGTGGPHHEIKLWTGDGRARGYAVWGSASRKSDINYYPDIAAYLEELGI